MRITLTQILLFPILAPLILTFWAAVIALALLVMPLVPLFVVASREDTDGVAYMLSCILACVSGVYLWASGLNFSTVAYGYGTIISCLYMLAVVLALVYGTWKVYLYHLPENLRATTAGVLPAEE